MENDGNDEGLFGGNVMLGIWFNHDDLLVRKNQEDFECLKLFGFTDAFILFKGCGF